MEIVFNNVSYVENNGTSYERECLRDVSFKIKNSKITAIITNEETFIPEMITAIKRPTKGEINADNVEIKKNIHIDEINLYRKKVAIVNCNKKRKFLTDSVKDEIGILLNNYDYKKDKKKRIIDSLKIVGLDESFLNRNPNNLSSSEQNKIIFASVLSYNPEVFIFVDFEKGMNYKEQENFKRLIKTIKNKYGKTIIFVSNNIKFLMDFVDYFVVIRNKEKVLEGTKKDFYKDELYIDIEKPKIIDFVKTAQRNKHELENYIDLKELIKGIYRDVT